MYNDRTPGDDPLHKVISSRPVDADSILIDSPELMFSGSYSRDGSSLVIEGINGNGLFQKLVVDDFFGGEQVGLVAPNGALLNFDTVSTLAGPETPGQYAATGSAGATLVKIGEVIKLEGSANSKKVDGIEGELKVGDPVYQGDTITTGPATKLGITFIDETVFSMSENATMVLDELVYKGPGNSDNSMIMNLVQGTFVFVTGEVAPSGNMTVETPIATMGIRGTTPKVTVDTNLGVGEFSILPDPNGEVGSYVLLDKNTGAILGQVESTDSKWVVTSLTGEAVEIGKSGIDLIEDSAALDEIRDLISRALGDRTELDGANSFGQIGFDSLSSGGPGPGGLEGVDDAIDGVPIAGDGVDGEPGDPPIAEDEAFFTGEDPLLLGEDVVIGTGGGPDFDPDGFVVLITQVNGIDLVFVGDVASVLLPSGAILLVSATGGITYDPNGAYDFLGLDDVDVDIFQYTIEDPEGFTDVATVTVTLTGSNDQPEITNTALTMHSDAFTEAGDTGNTTTTRTAMGNVSFADIDASDTHTSTVSAPLVTHTQDGGVTQVLGPIGNIAINLTETAADPAPVLQFAPDGTLISRPPPVTGNVAWTYTVQENELDFLAEGETLELIYTITIIDDSGVGAGTVADEPQTVTQDVVVTITGTNDVPQITAGVVTGTISDINEDATVPPQNDAGLQTTTGSLDFTDADLTDRPVATEETVSVELIAQDGVTPLVLSAGQMAAIENAFSIAPDGVSGANTNNGTINWTYSIAEAELDFLGAGEVVTATFLITVTDDEGATATQTVVITILGADDDAPVITPVVVTGSVSDVAEGSAVPPTANAGALETSGSITFSDVDLTDRPTASEATNSVTWLAADGVTPIALSAGQMTTIENAFSITPDGVSGANTNDGTIDWTYLIQEADIDFLAAGETVTAVFTITVTDDEGNTDTQDITITINGANDTPFIVATTDVSETLAETDAGLMTTGEFDVSDVDTSDVVSITGVAVAVSGNTSDPAYPGDAALDAMFTPQTGDIVASGVNQGTVNWTFDSGGEAFDYLAVGESITAVYTVTLSDGEGGTVTQDVTVTITGTNDAPQIAATATTDVSETLAETDAGLMTTGEFDVSDVDTSDVVSITGVAVAVSGNTSDPAYPGDAALDAMFTPQTGDIVASGVNQGTVNWTFDSGGEAFDYLAVGESITAVYTVTLSDGEGGTVTQDVTVTITGTNDAAVIAGDTTGTIDEAPGGPATATGTLTSDDVDNANNVFQAVAVPTSGDNGFGAFTVDAAGNWSYTLDDANPAVQALNDADMLTDTFTVLSEDGTAQVVTVTITGTNDAAVIAGDTTGTVDEAPGGPATATGSLASTDVDNTDNAFQAVASATASANGFGTFTVDASGNWSYTLDDTNATVQGLDDTDTLNDTFTVFSEDGTAQVVAIQITGTNDALTVTGLPDPAAVQEGNTGGVPTNESFLLTDFFMASDPDSADTPTVDETSIVITVNAASDTSNFSSLAIFGAGNSTSIVTDTANFDFLADGEQAVFDVSFDIVSGPDTVNETFTITINGENDAPVATAGSNVNATAGGGAVLIETAFSAFDVDATDTIATATISISSGFVLGEDVLNFGGAAGIADNYDATTGILTLTGPATVSEFVSAIQSITFQNTGSSPVTTNRTITYVLNDGMDDSLPVTSTVTVDGGGATTFFASTFTAASFMADEQSDPIGQLLSLPPIISLVDDNSSPDEETPDLSGLIENVSLEEVSTFENFEDGEGGAGQPLQNSTGTTGPFSQMPDTQPGAIETVDANPAQNDDSLQIQAQMNVVG